MLLNKIVSRYGQNSHVILPANLVGAEVYVLTKSELDKTFDFLDSALIKQKVYEQELQKIKSDLENFKNISNSRLTYLEKIVSFATQKQAINKEEEN